MTEEIGVRDQEGEKVRQDEKEFAVKIVLRGVQSKTRFRISQLFAGGVYR